MPSPSGDMELSVSKKKYLRVLRASVKLAMDSGAKQFVLSYDSDMPFDKLFFWKYAERIRLQAQGDDVPLETHEFDSSLRGMSTALAKIFRGVKWQRIRTT